MQKAFSYLSEFAKTSTYMKRSIVLAIEYFNFAVQYLAMCAIVKRAPRTGVLEHFTKNEFNAAKLCQGNRIILVANHKLAALGPSELVLDEPDYVTYQEFLCLTSKFAFRKRSSLFFTTTGAQWSEKGGLVRKKSKK